MATRAQVDHGALPKNSATFAARLSDQTTTDAGCTNDGNRSFVSILSVNITHEPYVCSYRVKNARHMRISAISASIWRRCTGLHWVAMNQRNHVITTASTSSIKASASENSPPSANAPLAAAHISQATGSTPSAAPA